MAKIFIGTSGFSYNHWKNIFYPNNLLQNDWLSYYSKYFDTVEINSSFYGTLRKSTYENWYKKTPENFVFAVKGPRFITHIKKLNNIEEPLRIFFNSTKGLGDKFNIVLWQFGAGFKLNTEKLDNFLKFLKSPKVRHCFEFRDSSWFCREVYDILKKNKSALVISDSPHFPKVKEITADFIYIRFHGGESLYASDYKEGELKKWAEEIMGSAKKGIDVYCYFNNDALGFAVKNALFLKKLCQS